MTRSKNSSSSTDILVEDSQSQSISHTPILSYPLPNMTNRASNTPSTPSKKKRIYPDTPRKRKQPAIRGPLNGLRNLRETLESVGRRVSSRLNLPFIIDEWQTHVIHRIREGYDSIVVAGTGYGKSLIFQGLAVLEKKKMIIIISPLKALERDQVSEAEAKGLKAAMINENTVCPELWARLRHGKDNLYYVSPEMALSGSFLTLWQDSDFRNRVHAVIVDEAHCIVEWGDDFRKEYAGLSRLRDYIGQAVPVVACTATCSSKTFNTIWSSLKFGHRPFWGLDAGCDRSNLTYLIRTLENTKNPVLDILNILPTVLLPGSDPTIIPKCILYFETLAECTKAMETLRKILPLSLRHVVQTFVGLTSEAGKEQIWNQFKDGTIRILCATDAAGMGCNVPDVKFVALFCVPRSLSVLAQRWGRAGRNRSVHGTCFLFAQSWAFRPKGEPQLTRSGKEKPLEPKSSKARREKLEPDLERTINLGFDSSAQECVHQYLKTHFRPETDLHTFKSLSQDYNNPFRKGLRSLKSNFQLSWTQLNLNRTAPNDKCCNFCIPALLTDYMPPCGDDPRLSAYASDFIFPLHITHNKDPTNNTTAALLPQRPHSHSISSNSSTTSSTIEESSGAVAIPMSHAAFIPLKHKFSLPESEREKLKKLLVGWRETHRLATRGEDSFLSSKVDLPDSALKKLVDHGGDFLRTPDVTPLYIKKLVQLDLASPADLREISNIISEWREQARSNITPSGAAGGRPRKVRKKASEAPIANKDDSTPRASPRRPPPNPLPQPVFRPMAVASATHTISAPMDIFSSPNTQAPITTSGTGSALAQQGPETTTQSPAPQILYYPPIIHPYLSYYPSSQHYTPVHPSSAFMQPGPSQPYPHYGHGAGGYYYHQWDPRYHQLDRDRR